MGLFNDFFQDIKYTIQQTYPADGVDLIDGKQNDSTELFVSPDGRAYRKHWGTIIAGALGFSNRQLEETQSWSNIFLKNYFGWRPNASWKVTIGRGIAMGLLNTLLLVPRAVIGVAKVVTEVIPGTASRFLLNTGEDIVNSGLADLKAAFDEEDDVDDEDKHGIGSAIWGGIKTLFGGIFYTVGAAAKAVYLTCCTLTSPIETVRSSWKNGNFVRIPFTGQAKHAARSPEYTGSMKHSFLGYPGKFFFAGLSVIGSIITFALTGPFAVKALGLALAPIAGKNAAATVTNAIDGIGKVKGIGPILSKIGQGFQWVISRPYISNVANFLHIGPTVVAAPPAVIGLGAVVGGLLSTVGTAINALYKKTLLPWWHSEDRRAGMVVANPRGSLFEPQPESGQPLLGRQQTAGGTEVRTDETEMEARSVASAPGEGSGIGPFFAVPRAIQPVVDKKNQSTLTPVASYRV